MRVTISPVKKRKHKRILQEAKGYRGQKGRCYRKAKQQLLRSYNNSFRDRKKFKGMMRRLWIIRINAALREIGISYSVFIGKLKHTPNHDYFDRKLLASMVSNNREDFDKFVGSVMKSKKTTDKVQV